MARVALPLALCLLLALAAARAAPSDYAWESEAEAEEAAAAEADEVAAAAEAVEEERAGRESPVLNYEQWQGEDDVAAAYDEQQDDAFQEGYQERGNAEPLTQQLQDTQVEQDSDEGTLSRLTSEVQGEQQFEQRTGQLQQSDQQVQQQQTSQQTQERQSDRLVNPSQNQSDSGYNPSRERDRGDFGLVDNSGNVQQQPQPGSQQNPASHPQQNPASHPQWPPRPGQTNPPAGYTQQGVFGYYKVFLTAVTWHEALMTCFADGAQLAVPTDEREALTIGTFYSKVKNQVKKSTDKDLFFIGASDVHKENTFVTILGTTFGQRQWFRWQKGEPNNSRKVEHCVLSNDKGFYWDGNCQNKYAFVCQFKDKCAPGSPRSDQIQQSADLQQQTQSQTRY